MNGILFSQLGASKKAKLTVKGGAVVDPDTGNRFDKQMYLINKLQL